MRSFAALLQGLASLAFVVAATACDDTAASDDDDDDDDDTVADAGVDAYIPPGESFAVEWGPYEIPAGDEDTRCVTKRLGNDAAVHIGAIHNLLGTASHHLIVYRVAEDAPENDQPEPCDPFIDTLHPERGSPLMITQKHEETLQLPDGVAFTLAPNQKIRLEMHYLNASEEPQTVISTSTFLQLPDVLFENEADFLFVGNPDVHLGPGKSTLGPSYLPVPVELDGKNIFAVTGHQHQWGTGVTVALSEGYDQPDTVIYDPESFSWSEPPTVYHTPTVTIPPAGGFRFTCNWDNQSGENVQFGERTSDEMCFFWAYYYPSVGSGRVCLHTDDYGADLCCPGGALCTVLINLLEGNGGF